MRLTYSELKFFSLHDFFYDYHLFDVIFNTCITAEIAQLGERQTEDLKVPVLNPENLLR